MGRCVHLGYISIQIQVFALVVGPCTLIRVPTAIAWCKAETINQTLTAELKSSPNLHIYPAIHLLFLFVIPATFAPSLGFPVPLPGARPNN